MTLMSPKKKSTKTKTKQIKTSVYLDSKDDLELITRAAAKVQDRSEPFLSRYIAQAAKQQARKDLSQ
jgi:hypothetical protein